MFNLDVIERELVESRPYVAAFSPGWGALFQKTHWFGRLVSAYGQTKPVAKGLWAIWVDNKPAGAVVGEFAADKTTIKFMAKHPAKVVLAAHQQIAPVTKPTRLQDRTWISETGRQEMVIVYHDADRAGPHIDVHIGTLSLIYRVKPDLYAQMRYNRDGYLTENSKALLMQHLKAEIANGSRVPQNLDHSPDQATYGWVKGGNEMSGYGAGATRQVIHQSEVDVFKARCPGPNPPDAGAIEFYAPQINSHRAMYVYQLYPGTDKRAPILIWGNKAHHPPHLEERLHLKMLKPEVLDDPPTKVDWSTTTGKYDGSSAYIVITPKGTTAWSPRFSRVTDEAIEYTHKLNGISRITSDETIVCMGEVMFRDERGEYVPQATGSGILNSNMVLPDHLTPEVRLYRVDRIGRKNTASLPFWENRRLQEQVSELNPKLLTVVELMSPTQAKAAGFEGVVAAPQDGGPIVDGFKVKWWGDTQDWRIDRVAFKPGDRGGIAGVVHCTSLESEKEFKLGPGQVGTEDLTRHMMANPERYEGAVLRVQSRQGHEGRAAKALSFHDDKGLAPLL